MGLLVAACSSSLLALAQDRYTVQTGDSLSAIAREQGTTVAALVSLNALGSSVIQPGQVLALPGSARLGVLEHAAGAGETLALLAERYGVALELLQAANPEWAARGAEALPLEAVVLVPPGPGLVLPLGAGENLLSVALRYGFTPSELARLNGLEPGEQPRALFIPEERVVATSAPGAATPPGPDGSARAWHLEQQRALLLGAASALEGYDPPAHAFVWPLSGRLSSLYGRRNLSVGGNTFHGGLDIVAAQGHPVGAARAGRVSRAGWGGAYGYVVYLEHGDGSETRYAHLSAFAVEPGAALLQGDTLGYVGSTGASTGPHLHFEIRFGGRSVDPLGYLPSQP